MGAGTGHKRHQHHPNDDKRHPDHRRQVGLLLQKHRPDQRNQHNTNPRPDGLGDSHGNGAQR